MLKTDFIKKRKRQNAFLLTFSPVVDFKILIYGVLSVLLCLSLNGCNVTHNNTENTPSKTDDTSSINQAENTKTTLKSLEEQSKKLMTAIITNIGSAACDTNKQCGAMAIGHKACGGPLDYLPYSTKNTNTTLLLELSAQHQATAKKINQLNNRMSDCAFISPPAVSCRNNRCQKNNE